MHSPTGTVSLSKVYTTRRQGYIGEPEAMCHGKQLHGLVTIATPPDRGMRLGELLVKTSINDGIFKMVSWPANKRTLIT